MTKADCQKDNRLKIHVGYYYRGERLGLGSWLLYYVRQKSLSSGRMIGSVLLVILSTLIFITSIGLVIITHVLSIFIGFPITMIVLPFGLGVRIGKGIKYTLFGFVCLLCIVVITVVYNFANK